MMRDKGGGVDPETQAGNVRSLRNSAADYYGLSGWQPHSPGGRLDLETLPSRMLANMSPLNKSGLSSGSSVSRRPVFSPDRVYPAGIESSLDRDTAAHDRGVLAAGYRGPADLLYNGEQAHPLSIPAYPGSKDEGAYLSLASAESSANPLYGRSVLENSLFNRGLTSLPNNPGLVPSYRSHIGTSGEDFVMDRSLDRKFLFGSNPTTGSLYPYNRILENYSQAAEHLSTGAKGNVDSSSTDRTGNQFPNPLSSHIPFTTTSDYVARNPPLYPFSHFGPGFAPENYSSYTSSLSHLSNYGQLSAPPPAHTRVSDGLTQRGSVVDGQSKQRSEGSISKPFDATVSRDYTTPAHQWSSATVADSKRKDSAVAFTSRPQNTNNSVSDKQKDPYDAPPLPFPKHEDGLDELMDNEFVGINSQEKQMPAPSQSCNQTNTHNLSQTSVAWNETDRRYTQSDQVQSSGNSTQSAQFPHASAVPAISGGGGTMKKQSVERPAALVDSLKEKTDDLLNCPDPGSFLQKFRAAISSAKQSDSSSRTNGSPFSFPEQTHLYGDSNGSGSDTEIEENFTFQTARVMNKGAGNQAKEKYVSVASGTDDQGGQRFPYTIMSKSKGNDFAKGFKSEVQISEQGLQDVRSLKTAENEDLLQYDSSTSEYDPSSPYNTSVQKQKQKKKTKVATKNQAISTSSVKNVEDGDMEWPSPKIKLTIKTERITDPQSLNKSGGQRKQRDKGLVSTGGKRGSKTCPLCLKTFSRADSLTCHMRVHTGDRPYHCDQCGATYKVSSHLRDHIRSKHSNDKPFECERCGKPFTYSTARRRHEKICGKELSERVEFKCAVCHKGFVTDKGFSKHQEKCGVVKVYDNAMKQEKTSKCSYCHKVFDSTPSLYRHQRFFCTKRHKGGQYCCGECGKTFSKHNLYMVHTRHHSGEKPFRCLKCHACFYDKHSLKQHMMQHEGNRKFDCSSCDRAFHMKWCLSLHVRRMHCGKNSYKCNKCTSYFASGYQLSRHARQFHQQEKQFKFAPSKPGFSNGTWMKRHSSHALQSCRRASGRAVTHHACKMCNKRFRMKDLRSHILSEHPGVRLSEAVAKQPFYCNVCCRVFSCQESFHVHKLQHSGQKPFYCHRCNVAFLLKAAFKLHQQRHLGYKPYRCKHCRKLFHWHASLTKHMVTHHRDKEDSKRFICHKCGMDFAQQICLNVHLKRHHIAKPCVCAQCGKRFVDFRHLRLHMSTHNGPKRYPCEKCGAGFEHKYLLDDHIKKRHTEQPKQSWLCEECGKSLCRRDALQKHMALHDKYRNGQIPQVGRRRKSVSMSADTGSANSGLVSVEGPRKRGRPKGWRKNAPFGQQNTSMSLPTTFDPNNKVNFKSAVTTNAHDLTRGDLVGTTPISNASARFGTSSPYGTHPNFGMRSSFGAPVSVGTSSTFGESGGVSSSPSVDVHPSFGMSSGFGASSSTGTSNYGSNSTFNAASNFDASANFGASPNFTGPPNFGTPPNFNMQQSTQEQFNYPYHYNTYIDHNMPCPSGTDQ